MDKLTLAEVAQVTGAAVNSDEKISFECVTTDSRKVTSGSLFVALKGEIFNDADIATLNSITDSTERAEYRKLLTKADNMTLDDVSLATREGSQVAIRVIDGALDYALDEQATLGTYINRLNYVDENIMTKSENLQHTDSSIRDTDIAKEMTKFARYNLLTQSAQFILAQANQLPGMALNLLRPESTSIA